MKKLAIFLIFLVMIQLPILSQTSTITKQELIQELNNLMILVQKQNLIIQQVKKQLLEWEKKEANYLIIYQNLQKLEKKLITLQIERMELIQTYQQELNTLKKDFVNMNKETDNLIKTIKKQDKKLRFYKITTIGGVVITTIETLLLFAILL